MSDLRIAVLGVGVMGADHVTRIESRISGARVAVVNDYVTEKAGAPLLSRASQGQYAPGSTWKPVRVRRSRSTSPSHLTSTLPLAAEVRLSSTWARHALRSR